MEHDLSMLRDLVEELQQEDDLDVIFVESEAIFDDQHVPFVLPTHLLVDQELELEPPEPLAIILFLPRQPTRCETLEEG